jgi:SAM-dependent methyltransferase
MDFDEGFNSAADDGVDKARCPVFDHRVMRLFRLLSPALALLAGPVFGEPVPKPDPLYETREQHDPNGIGTFFMGREIAHVMGHQAADWLERPEREEEEKTEQMVEALKFRAGEVVADIGCGSGYVARRISKHIGDKGIIYGVDIQQEMLDLLMKRMAMFRITNVKPILGELTDPKLPAESCDTMIMVDVYHEFDHPYEMISAMVKALKPVGASCSWSFAARTRRCRSSCCTR